MVLTFTEMQVLSFAFGLLIMFLSLHSRAKFYKQKCDLLEEMEAKYKEAALSYSGDHERYIKQHRIGNGRAETILKLQREKDALKKKLVSIKTIED